MPNSRAYKTLVTAKYAGIKVDIVENFEMANTKTEAYLARFPHGKVCNYPNDLKVFFRDYKSNL